MWKIIYSSNSAFYVSISPVVFLFFSEVKYWYLLRIVRIVLKVVNKVVWLVRPVWLINPQKVFIVVYIVLLISILFHHFNYKILKNVSKVNKKNVRCWLDW